MQYDVVRLTIIEKFLILAAPITFFVYWQSIKLGLYFYTSFMVCAALAVILRLWQYMYIDYEPPKHLSSSRNMRQNIGYFYIEFLSGFLCTTFAFGTIYFHWWKIYPENFLESIDNSSLFLNSFYYSFLTITTAGTLPITQSALLLKMLVMIEIGFGLVIVGVFLASLPRFSKQNDVSQ